MEKCPLCGGRISDGVCGSCGYELPDYGKMSAPYDLDPSNDLFGAAGQEPEFPSIEPEPDMQPRTVPPPNIKVVQPNVPPTQQVPPPAQQSGTLFVGGVAGFVKKHWWQLLVTAFVPLAGFIIGARYIDKGRNTHSFGERAQGIALMIIAVIMCIVHSDIFGVLGYLLW